MGDVVPENGHLSKRQKTTDEGTTKDDPYAKVDRQRLVWIDCEMTGLNLAKDRLIEIACLVTEKDLSLVDNEGLNLIIHQNDDLLNGMDEWCTRQHGQSGLTEAVRKSRVSEADAETAVLQYIKRYVPAKVAPLAGNSVYADRSFLAKYMPSLTEYLHYRIVDVSSIKELCRRWRPDVYEKSPAKQSTHRALDDIKESIEELRFYKSQLFDVKT